MSIKFIWNVWTSNLFLLPRINSLHAQSRLLRSTISSKSQLNLALMRINNTDPIDRLIVLDKLIQAYKLWHDIIQHLSKKSRLTLGIKIDSIFLDIMELIFFASLSPQKEKLPYIYKTLRGLDLLKFFLRVAWEIKEIDNKKYIAISKPLNEIGKMLGGWYRNLLKENSHQ